MKNKILAALLTLLTFIMMFSSVLTVGASEVTESKVIDYASAEEGELLYTVDFSGKDGVFAPVPVGAAAKHFDYIVSEAGNELTVKGRADGLDKTACYWGGTFAGLEANKETFYTMVYKVKANGTVGKNNSVGIGGWILDAKVENYQFYNNYSNHNTITAEGSIDDRRSAISVADQKQAEYVMWNTIGEYAIDVGLTLKPGEWLSMITPMQWALWFTLSTMRLILRSRTLRFIRVPYTRVKQRKILRSP